MALTFDYGTELISVPQAEAQPLLIQDLVNAIRTEEATERGITYDQILDATGKADLGGGVLTGITAALRGTWKLNFAAGAYQAAVDGGNLADGLSRVNNTGSPQVLFRASVATTLVNTTGVDPGDAADAVMAALVEGGMSTAEVLRLLLAHAAGNATGLESGSPVFKAVDGVKTRISGTYSSGTRNVTTRDGS